MKPVAIVQHDPHDGPSYFATWLQSQGIDFTVYRMFESQRLPADVTAFSGLCMLGGPMSANDALPYYPQLLDLVRDARRIGTPVIGHCLGGQLLSRALGGTVQAAEHVEIGWSLLEPAHHTAEAWFGPQPLQLFQWHAESFSLPLGATHLLAGRNCANQAFAVDGIHLGMQFHCEMDRTKTLLWLELGASEMQQCVSPGVQDAEAILEHLEADMATSQRIADRIYTRWSQSLVR